MKNWYKKPAVNAGLRVGGAALLAIGSSAVVRLQQLAPGVPVRDASSVMIALAAAAFLCGSAGSALLFVGPGLWTRVEVSERWRRLPAAGADARRPEDRER